MREKNQISLAAGGIPCNFGRDRALKLGFTYQEFRALFNLAWLPQFVTTPHGMYNDEKRTALLEIIGRRPKEALELVVLIRNQKEKMRNSVIRNFLTNLNDEPPNWTLPDKVIAERICKKINQAKMKGNALQQLIENIKKQRQTLAKKYPVTKGKKEAA